MSRRTFAVGSEPLALRNLSRRASAISSLSAALFLCFCPFSTVAAHRRPDARPNTTTSSKDLEPRRLPPYPELKTATPTSTITGIHDTEFQSLLVTHSHVTN